MAGPMRRHPRKNQTNLPGNSGDEKMKKNGPGKLKIQKNEASHLHIERFRFIFE